MKKVDYVEGMKNLAQYLSIKRIAENPAILPGGMADLWLPEKDIEIMRIAMRSSCAAILLTQVRDMRGTQQDYQSQKIMLMKEAYLGEEPAHRVLVGLWVVAGKDIASKEGYTGQQNIQQNQQNQKSQQNQRAPSKKRNINTYEQYLQALKEYCLNLGKNDLCDSEIDSFIRENRLSQWGITIVDVREDVRKVVFREGKTGNTQFGADGQRGAAEPQKARRRNINTYEQYLQALKEYCKGFGRKRLYSSEIQEFIKEHRLWQWDINADDVRKDIDMLFGNERHVNTDKSHSEKQGYVESQISKKERIINTYEQYLQALKEYCISLGTNRLSVGDIERFISDNKLDQQWGITAKDIEMDIRRLCGIL